MSTSPQQELAHAEREYDAVVSRRLEVERDLARMGVAVSSAREKLDHARRAVAAAIPVDRTDTILAGTGKPPADNSYREPGPSGQHRDHIGLSEAERANGFVRPVRTAYRHTGRKICGHNLGPSRLDDSDYVAKVCGGAPGHDGPHGAEGEHRVMVATQATLDRLAATGYFKGCGTVTTMQGKVLSESYARDPSFYGATFCIACGDYFPVGERNGEFVWLENDGREINKVGT